MKWLPTEINIIPILVLLSGIGASLFAVTVDVIASNQVTITDARITNVSFDRAELVNYQLQQRAHVTIDFVKDGTACTIVDDRAVNVVDVDARRAEWLNRSINVELTCARYSVTPCNCVTAAIIEKHTDDWDCFVAVIVMLFSVLIFSGGSILLFVMHGRAPQSHFCNILLATIAIASVCGFASLLYSATRDPVTIDTGRITSVAFNQMELVNYQLQQRAHVTIEFVKDGSRCTIVEQRGVNPADVDARKKEWLQENLAVELTCDYFSLASCSCGTAHAPRDATTHNFLLGTIVFTFITGIASIMEMIVVCVEWFDAKRNANPYKKVSFEVD